MPPSGSRSAASSSWERRRVGAAVDLVLVRPPVDERHRRRLALVGDREAGDAGLGERADGFGQGRARQRPVGSDAVVLGLSLAPEERDLSWFVRHGLDRTGNTGQYLSANGQDRSRVAAARGAPGPGLRDGAELAARLGVDVRTVRRDVVALRDLGIPVEGERGRGGSYRLRPGYRVPPLMFTPGEAAAVALGLMAARRLGLESDDALAKVRRVLPDRSASASSRSSTRSASPASWRPRRRTARRCSRSPRRPAATAASSPSTPIRRASTPSAS